MPGRFTRNDFEGKEWDYNSLSDKEKKAYDKKEFYYRKLAMKQQEAEEAWAKGDLTSETYRQINDELYKRQRMVLRNDYSFVDDNERDFNSNNGKEKIKMEKGRKFSNKEKFEYRAKASKPGSKVIDSDTGEVIRERKDFERGVMAGRNAEAHDNYMKFLAKNNPQKYQEKKAEQQTYRAQKRAEFLERKEAKIKNSTYSKAKKK